MIFNTILIYMIYFTYTWKLFMIQIEILHFLFDIFHFHKLNPWTNLWYLTFCFLNMFLLSFSICIMDLCQTKFPPFSFEQENILHTTLALEGKQQTHGKNHKYLSSCLKPKVNVFHEYLNKKSILHLKWKISQFFDGTVKSSNF